MIWGDKSPSYIRHIPLLQELYPRATIIHIVRDVRDYSLSINKAWGKNMLRAAQRWQDDTCKAGVDIQKLGDSGLEIRFEDLLGNPEMVLNDICNTIGISFEKNMIHLNKPSENIGDARGVNKIVADNKQKWNKKMSPALIRRIEEICCTQLSRYGYETGYQGEPKRIGTIGMKWYKMLDGWNLVLSDSDKRGILKNLMFHIRYNNTSGNRM
ncbi:MAG: sulfotransferase [Thermodesulfobacteriota bacterium]|nr:sulfotransferase [Thermodesulfobacteriota bacterium]